MLLLTHTSSPSPQLSIRLSTPTTTAHQGEDPITQKRLLEGGSAWDTPKKVLEWIKTCPNLYCSAYPLLLHTHQSSLTWVGQMPKFPLRIFQHSAGTIQRAKFAILGGGNSCFLSILLCHPWYSSFHYITVLFKSLLLNWHPLIHLFARHHPMCTYLFSHTHLSNT